MTIKNDLSHLLEEIHAAESRRDERLASLQDQIERYHGPWYAGSGSEDKDKTDPENHSYEFVSAFVPQAVHDRPKVKMESRRAGSQKLTAQSLEIGTNQWVIDTDFQSFLEESAYDYMFRWACSITSIAPRVDAYHLEDPFLLPQVHRLSPYDFGWDAMAAHPSRARLFFHRWSIDKDDLIEMAEEDMRRPKGQRDGWNLKAIKKLVTGEPLKREHIDGRHVVDRNQVWLYDVWLADGKVDDRNTSKMGFHGVLQTIGAFQGATKNFDGARIRQPVDYFGPRTGPYEVGGCYIVPDKNEPLSPLVVTQQQSDALNSFAIQFLDDILSYCKKTFIAGEDPQQAERINNAKHQHVTLLEGVSSDLQNRLATVETGGASEQGFVGLQYLRSLLERVSGFTDVQKGNITGTGTATEVGFAVEASQGRSDYIRRKFVKYGERCLRKVAFFLYHTDQVIFPTGTTGLNAVQEATGEQPPPGSEAFFFGGDFGDEDGASFDDLSLTIDLYSMIRTSEAAIRRKSEILLNVLSNVLPILTLPGVRAQALMELLANLENLPELLSVFDFEEMGKGGTGLATPQSGGQQAAPGGRPAISRTQGTGTGGAGPDIAAALGALSGQMNGTISRS